MAFHNFHHNTEHGIIVCRQCEACLVPKESSWTSHLRNRPHSMKGEHLVCTLEHFHSFGHLRSVDDLRKRAAARRRLRQPCRPLDGVCVYDGYMCICAEACEYRTRRLDKIRHHMSVHGRKPKEHSDATPLWRACRLQTYFTAKGIIDYFEVDDAVPIHPQQTAPLDPSCTISTLASTSASTSTPTTTEDGRAAIFEDVKGEIEAHFEPARRAQDPLRANARADREPWLVNTGFGAHLDGLLDAEIRSSYALPSSVDAELVLDDAPEDASNSDLQRILVAAEHTLRDAYRLCSDTSARYKLTQQRAIALSQFRLGDASEEPNSRGSYFRRFKNERTLVNYFRLTKQLLTYYYRVVYRRDGHFTSNTEGHSLPQDVIKPSAEQLEAMNAIIEVLRQQDALDNAMAMNEEDDYDYHLDADQLDASAELDEQLKKAIRELLVSLMSCPVGSPPFQSALLSFCAMRSRSLVQRIDGSVDPHGPCKWREPGNLNSDLSALIWTSQLMLFDSVCFACRDNELRILPRLKEECRAYCHDMAETPFGQMLQWRSYLFAACKDKVAEHQARWSMDGTTVNFKGTDLQMHHISQLVASEYKTATQILYDDLLFGILADTPRIEPWRLQDDLDQAEQGFSCLTDSRNAELLADTRFAVVNKIEASPELRRTFVRQLDPHRPDMALCPTAVALYENRIQDFLERLLVMIHISSGPPLRAPEILSVIVSNTDARRRSMFVWEKSVLLRVGYHKSLELTGAMKDNHRFLPAEVGTLLLTFLAFVQPIRQAFLRISQPGARLSAYLWSKMDGSVWDDGRVSACLSRACARAMVPMFKVAWWRQVAASITKEKFSQQERAHFDLDDIESAEEIEDEAELAYLAGMSNHSFHTFNYAYAGSTNLTPTSLLHRAFIASHSWRSLLDIDAKLLAERPDPGSGVATQRLLNSIKSVQHRERPKVTAEDLGAVARKLYCGDLQFRPGQRRAMLAIMGRRQAEQVVVVMPTGAGKSLLFMVGACLEGAETTILILPTVALRANMLAKLDVMNIRYHVWQPGSKKAAPIVLVSTEAAITLAFKEYANRLLQQQRLDRIVIDECHLTLTARSYRRSMMQLAWHVRDVETQTVWLTATLPPIFEDAFISHNKLTKPLIVRESTNRSNLCYSVRTAEHRMSGMTCYDAVRVVDECRARTDIWNGQRDRIIVYCTSKELVARLAEMLGCAAYTSESGSEADKAAIIQDWICGKGSPVIVATSALGVGFDYPHVRFVIHLLGPDLLTDFSQESGRAGRDGMPAESILLAGPQLDDRAPASGKASSAEKGKVAPGADKEAMQLYRSRKYCLRGVLSQLLDQRSDWRWCMEGDQLCSVCPGHHSQARGPGDEFHFTAPAQAGDPSTLGSSQRSIQGRGHPSIHGSGLPSIHGSSHPSIHGSSHPSIHGSGQHGGQRRKQQPDPPSEQRGDDWDQGETDIVGVDAIDVDTIDVDANDELDALQGPETRMTYTGRSEIRSQRWQHTNEESEYRQNMEAIKGMCMVCRVSGVNWHHAAGTCSDRFGWIRAKTEVMERCRSKKKRWMPWLKVCWRCFQPQWLCRAADPAMSEGAGPSKVARRGRGTAAEESRVNRTECEYRDLVIPLCHAVFKKEARTDWLRATFHVEFSDVNEYMLWVGTPAMLAGKECVMANCVAAAQLQVWDRRDDDEER